MIFDRARNIRKACRFYGLFSDYSDAELDDLIRIERIRKDIICGVVFITKGISPTEIIRHQLALSPYVDEKEAKRIDHEKRLATKSPSVTLEREERFYESVEKLFGIAILRPDPEKHPVSDYRKNTEMFMSLYAIVTGNSGIQKKKMA